MSFPLLFRNHSLDSVEQYFTLPSQPVFPISIPPPCLGHGSPVFVTFLPQLLSGFGFTPPLFCHLYFFGIAFTLWPPNCLPFPGDIVRSDTAVVPNLLCFLRPVQHSLSIWVQL